MSAGLEGIVRPFSDRSVTPTPFTKPGAQQNQLVRIAIGYAGTIKTVSTSYSCTVTSKLGQLHKEGPPNASDMLQRAMDAAAESE